MAPSRPSITPAACCKPSRPVIAAPPRWPCPAPISPASPIPAAPVPPIPTPSHADPGHHRPDRRRMGLWHVRCAGDGDLGRHHRRRPDQHGQNRLYPSHHPGTGWHRGRSGLRPRRPIITTTPPSITSIARAGPRWRSTPSAPPQPLLMTATALSPRPPTR